MIAVLQSVTEAIGMAETPEAIIAALTGRHTLRLPSNRLGLFLALRHWTSPGQRLLMSPISADEVLFLVLAAGLVPVMAPVSRRDGNIDPDADLSGVDAVLTTNLYGLPDRIVNSPPLAGKVLIEDVAHALETTVDGRPVGTFGSAGVFSLSKHAGAGSGGVLAVKSASDRAALVTARDRLLAPGAFLSELATVMSAGARNAALKLGYGRTALAVMRRLGLEEDRDKYRIPLNAARLKATLSAAPDLAPFDSWVRADLHGYRTRQHRLSRWYQTRRLAMVPEARVKRLAGVRLLAELPTAAAGVADNLDQPLFRVPLLVERRDAGIEALEQRGVPTGYLFDPPYDDYAGDFAEASAAPDAARWWAAHVLPVDPLYAHRALPVLKNLTPARERSG